MALRPLCCLSTGEKLMSNTLLRKAIRRGLRGYGIAGASVALGCAAIPAFAQTADKNATEHNRAERFDDGNRHDKN